MRADPPATGGVDHQLLQPAFEIVGQGVFHRPKAADVNIDLAVLGARRLLGQADRANRRLAEHGAWHVRVADRHAVGVEQVFGQGVTLGDSHRRQVHAVGDIADGEHARQVGARLVIDDHRPLVVDRDTGGLEAKIAGAGRAAGGVHHLVCVQGAAIGEMDAQATLGFFDAFRQPARVQANVLFGHFLGQRGADIAVETAQR